MLYMLLHISTDRIFFLTETQKEILEYGNLEKNLPDFLYSRFAEAATEGSTVVVINWPWSFTNIRIATLALNTYNTLHNFGLHFMSIDKLQWYALLYKAERVGRYCVMYIGQKKNFWVVDLAQVTHNSMASISDAVKMIHVDNLLQYMQDLDAERFVDDVVAEAKDVCDSILWTYTQYTFTNNDSQYVMTQIESIWLQTSVLLDANYMMEANVG